MELEVSDEMGSHRMNQFDPLLIDCIRVAQLSGSRRLVQKIVGIVSNRRHRLLCLTQ